MYIIHRVCAWSPNFNFFSKEKKRGEYSSPSRLVSKPRNGAFFFCALANLVQFQATQAHLSKERLLKEENRRKKKNHAILHHIGHGNNRPVHVRFYKCILGFHPDYIHFIF